MSSAQPKPRARPKRERRTTAEPPADIDAGIFKGVPKGQLPADLRPVSLNKTDVAWVRVEYPLSPGCSVVLINRNKKAKVGIYWPGPQQQFAALIGDPLGLPSERREAAKPVTISVTDVVVRVVGFGRSHFPDRKPSRKRAKT